MKFGHVRLHDNPVAQRSAADHGALAYTTGSHIVSGRSSLDDETLYHEAGHVWQQAMGKVAGTDDGTGTKVSSPGDPFEVKATENGRMNGAGRAPTWPCPAPPREAACSAPPGPPPNTSSEHRPTPLPRPRRSRRSGCRRTSTPRSAGRSRTTGTTFSGPTAARGTTPPPCPGGTACGTPSRTTPGSRRNARPSPRRRARPPGWRRPSHVSPTRRSPTSSARPTPASTPGGQARRPAAAQQRPHGHRGDRRLRQPHAVAEVHDQSADVPPVDDHARQAGAGGLGPGPQRPHPLGHRELLPTWAVRRRPRSSRATSAPTSCPRACPRAPGRRSSGTAPGPTSWT